MPLSLGMQDRPPLKKNTYAVVRSTTFLQDDRYRKKVLAIFSKTPPNIPEYVSDFFAVFAEYTRDTRSAGRIVIPDGASLRIGVLVFNGCAAAEKAEATGKDDCGVKRGRRNFNDFGAVGDRIAG